LEDLNLKKLCDAVDRFAYKHPRFGIPNLMRYIIFGTAVVYLLTVFAGYSAVSFLAFSWNGICHGELWRLVTFIFMPDYTSANQIIWMIFFLYLYYMIGTTLEREWGTAKFNLYYLSGVLLTVIGGVISGLVTGSAWIAGTSYVNLSMFFAFAMMYPDMQFLLFFIIPVKVKWLAWLDGAFFAIAILLSLFQLDVLGVLLPIIALLNFVVFFWNHITDWIDYRRGRAKRQTSHQTIQFKAAVKKQHQKEAAQGYRHKCAVCGRTDTDYPELEFRYCSRCAGYHCFCQDHIFNHEHFTE
jgi:hypothetical protein